MPTPEEVLAAYDQRVKALKYEAAQGHGRSSLERLQFVEVYDALAASQERVRELEYLLDYAYYLRFIGEATNHDQELEYWGRVEVAIKPMHASTVGAEGEQGLDREGGVHDFGKGMGDDRDPSGLQGGG